MSGLAGGSRRPAAAIARAAALCCALALAACGEQGGQPPAGEPGEPGASTTGGTQGSAGGTSETSGGLAVVAGPSGPLDTTNWVMQPPFYAAGDEPAWRLEIADGWFSFKRSALRAIEEPMVQPVKDGAADVFQTGSLKIVIRREACQAGGQTSELTVDVTYDDDTFGGCAFPALAAGVATTPEAAAVYGRCWVDRRVPCQAGSAGAGDRRGAASGRSADIGGPAVAQWDALRMRGGDGDRRNPLSRSHRGGRAGAVDEPHAVRARGRGGERALPGC